MTSTSSRLTRSGFATVVSALVLSQAARADEGIRVDASATLTNAQLAAFADLVEQTHEEVARRLQSDASLAPIAATAAEARMQRKHAGKLRAAVGFGVLGVGGIASALLWSSAFSRAGGGYDVDSTLALGAYIAGACAAVGLGVGISGIVVMARQGQVESEAVARYQRTAREGSFAVAGGHVVRLPLLALSF